MDPNVAAKLRSEFPDAEDLAWQRIYAGRTIFFDTKTHRRLPGFNDRKILTALIFANSLTADWRASLKLSVEEKKVWARHFLIAASLLILWGFFNFFDDQDHDGIPDILQQFFHAAVSIVISEVKNPVIISESKGPEFRP